MSFVNNLFFTLKQELTPNSRYRQGNRWKKSRKGPESDAVIYLCLPLFDAAITDKRIRVYVSSHGLSLLADIFSVLLLFFYLIFLLFRFISFFHSIELSLRSFITWRKPETSGARMHAHLGNFQSSLQLFFVIFIMHGNKTERAIYLTESWVWRDDKLAKVDTRYFYSTFKFTFARTLGDQNSSTLKLIKKNKG